MEVAGLGVVIHDSYVRMMGSLAECVPFPTLVATVEAFAYRRALLLAKELCILDAVFEGDAELIIKVLLGREVSHPEYGHVIQDSLILGAEFRFCKFNHVKRLGNSVAYFLARRSKSSNKLQV